MVVALTALRPDGKRQAFNFFAALWIDGIDESPVRA
jgi:hypothetical protein